MTELERLFAKIQSTPALKQQLESAPRNPEAFNEAVLKIAAANDFHVTAADLKQPAPLSDSDLGQVSGGVLIGGGAKQERKTLADYWYQIFYA